MRSTALLHGVVLVLVAACPSATTTTTSTVTPVPVTNAPPPPPPKELDGARLCRIVADVADAAARSNLSALKLRFDATSSKDRHDAFGAMLSGNKNEERFRDFHEDAESHPGSAVSSLGECLVYADWKMARESEAPCAKAETALGKDGAVVDVARVDLLARTDAKAAVAKADEALAKAPACEALHLAKARAVAATGDVEAAKAGWAAAGAAVDHCFVCAAERARLLESSEGRAAAASEYEKALKFAPDHADTLRRFAAAVAGVDDVRALAAYDAAVEAGARDFATLMAAAKLASRLATTPAQVDRALTFAKRAAGAQSTDPEAKRLVVDLAMKKGDDAFAVQAAQQLLSLVPDDVAGHTALARAALKADKLEDAVVHYDQAFVELAAGRTGGLDDATVAAVRAERAGLLSRLMVDGSTPKGTATAVAKLTQQGLQKLWKDRLKKKVVSSGGELSVVIETDASGAVVDVLIKDGGVKDPAVRAAAIAWLRRASITGGARRYTLDLLLQ